MQESVTLSQIQEFVLNFLRGRDDAVLLGAQAVNAYVGEPRMTQDVDLLSTRAAELAEELREGLNHEFNIAVRVREIGENKGLRIYQVRKEGNRHLVDLRFVTEFPAWQKISEIQVLTPPELIASKIISYAARRGKPKSGTDWRDIALLLLTFPELKTESGAVTECLTKANVGLDVRQIWSDFVAQEISLETDDEDLNF